MHTGALRTVQTAISAQVCFLFFQQFAAKRAFGSVDGMLTVGKGMNARRADGGALLTADAFVPQKGKLTFLRFTFGVMTPDTVQRTALEKDDRADALTIVERKMLHIENMRGVH
jgi:hypothetical protein